MLLVSPAIAAHILATGTPAQQVYLEEWRWGCLVALPLALVLVRLALSRDGRVRGSGWLKRWLGLFVRSLVLLGAMNAMAFVKLKPSAEHVIDDGMPAFFAASAVGVGVLVGIRLWDRRPRRVTVAEVRAAAAEADRALRRVRAENERVRRQAEQVQARLAALRARGGGPGARPGGRADGHPRGRGDGAGGARRTGAGGAKQGGPGSGGAGRAGAGGAGHSGTGGAGNAGASGAGQPERGGAKASGGRSPKAGAGGARQSEAESRQARGGGGQQAGAGEAQQAGAGGGQQAGIGGRQQARGGGGQQAGVGGAQQAGAGGRQQAGAGGGQQAAAGGGQQAGAGGGKQGGARRDDRAARGWDGGSLGVDFQSLRVFHRESYQCADTAHMAYQSAQTSLQTMSYLVRRTRIVPQWVGLPGRAARLARAEMRAAAVHLADSHLKLRVQVDEGLGMVRTLNANTSELKVEIRDSCGERGERWYLALEERIEAAREERRASRAW
ncbi:hypothetical protein LX86_003041 [Lentzea aerocolonigenes]|nr:hypothetical protein [Lentzea aerocolonigenes]